MAQEQRGLPTYILHAPVEDKVIVHVAQESILDGWLQKFDGKQAALDARQNAFFDKLGIRVISEAEKVEEPIVDAEFEDED